MPWFVHFKALRLLSFLGKTNSENTKVSRLSWLAVTWSEVGNHLGEVAWWKFLVCSTLPTQVSTKENLFIIIFYDPLKKESLQFSMQMQALFFCITANSRQLWVCWEGLLTYIPMVYLGMKSLLRNGSYLEVGGINCNFSASNFNSRIWLSNPKYKLGCY